MQLNLVFPTRFFDILKMSGGPSVLPIFIVGMPRSGSTLLESVLDAHPSIAGLSEDNILYGRIGLENVASAISKNANEVNEESY